MCSCVAATGKSRGDGEKDLVCWRMMRASRRCPDDVRSTIEAQSPVARWTQRTIVAAMNA